MAADAVGKGLGYLTVKYLENVFSINAPDFNYAWIQAGRRHNADTMLERLLPSRCWERNMVM
jgi:hypothetical protein